MKFSGKINLLLFFCFFGTFLKLNFEFQRTSFRETSILTRKFNTIDTRRTAFATLIHTDERSLINSAVILAKRLFRLNSTQNSDLVALIPRNVISTRNREILTQYGYRLVLIDPVGRNQSKFCDFHKKPGFYSDAFGNLSISSPMSKIYLWALIQYRQVVYLSPNTYPITDLTHLITNFCPITAAPSAFPPSKFSTDFMIICPQLRVFNDLKAEIMSNPTLCTDFDQLNAYFSEWYHLPLRNRLNASYLTTDTFGVQLKRTGNFLYGKWRLSSVFEEQFPVNFVVYGTNLIISPRNEFLRSSSSVLNELLSRDYAQMTDSNVSNGDALVTTFRSQQKYVISRPKSLPVSVGANNSAVVFFLHNDNSGNIDGINAAVNSIHSTGSAPQNIRIVVIVTENTSLKTRNELTANENVTVKIIPMKSSPFPEQCRYTWWKDDPPGSSEWAKLYIFNMTEFDRILYLDSDVIVFNGWNTVREMLSMESVMEYPIKAAPGLYPMDSFNAGVLVVVPNQKMFENMLESIPKLGSNDCGDQGFLQKYFYDWYWQTSAYRLREEYNMHSRLLTNPLTRANAIVECDKLLSKAKILHFSGSAKPWKMSVYCATKDLSQLWKKWKQTFQKDLL